MLTQEGPCSPGGHGLLQRPGSVRQRWLTRGRAQEPPLLLPRVRPSAGSTDKGLEG